MKRPLGTGALVFALCLFVYLAAKPADSGQLCAVRDGRAAFMLEEGRTYQAAGTVDRVERRSRGGKDELWIYLDSVEIREGPAGETAALPCGLLVKTAESRPKLGSRVAVSGRFSCFEQARNPGEFDAARYYRIMGVGGALQGAVITGLGERYSVIREGLYRLRCHWEERLYRFFPEKEASVLCTMLLGDRTALDEGVKELYQRNGIVHILSISGLHITILGMGLYRLLRKLGCPIPAAAVTGGILLLGYGVMTGMGVSACRAIGMYLIRMLGELLGRTYDMLTALGAMAVLMLVRQPEYLYHSGFLLSFGSICGIGILLPAMQPGEAGAVLRKRVWHKAAGALLPGVAITLATLPVHLWFYYEIPVYAVFLNLLVLPLMGPVMGIGLAVMLLPGAGALAGVLARADCLILRGYEWLCGLFDRLPGHTWTPGCPEVWQIAVYYGILAAFVLCRSHAAGRSGISGKSGEAGRSNAPGRSNVSARLRRCSVLFPVLALWVIAARFHAGLEVTFLDVGQGDGICVRTGAGEVCLFDCGSSSESGLGEYTLIPYLKHEGITRIDAVFVSHPDADHCNAVLYLLEEGSREGITIERLFLPDIAEERRMEEFGPLLDGVAACGQKEPVAVSYLSEGDAWQSGSTAFTCLHPQAGTGLEDANAYSQCFYVRDGGFGMLLTGDVEGEGEEELLAVLSRMELPPVTLLKVAHHGSRNSTPEELLRIVRPRLAVISCGEDNSYGHPHPELLARLAEYVPHPYITAQTGAVTVKAAGNEVRIRTFLRDGANERRDIDAEDQ